MSIYKTTKPKAYGFTLIEILAITIVISVLTYISINRLYIYNIRQTESQAHSQTIDNVSANIEYYAAVLLAASNTGNNQFDTTLTIDNYNNIARGIGSQLTINIATPTNITLFFGSTGFADVINNGITRTRATNFSNREHAIRFRTDKYHAIKINHNY